MPPVSPTRSTPTTLVQPMARTGPGGRGAVRVRGRAQRPASSAAPAARGRRACPPVVLPAGSGRLGSTSVTVPEPYWTGEQRLPRPLDEHAGRAADRLFAVRAVFARVLSFHCAWAAAGVV